MEIVNFPKQPKQEATTAGEWLRKIADVVEERYGKDVKLENAVITFSSIDGSVYFYDTGNNATISITSEIGLLALAQQHLINISAE